MASRSARGARPLVGGCGHCSHLLKPTRGLAPLTDLVVVEPRYAWLGSQRNGFGGSEHHAAAGEEVVVAVGLEVHTRFSPPLLDESLHLLDAGGWELAGPHPCREPAARFHDALLGHLETRSLHEHPECGRGPRNGMRRYSLIVSSSVIAIASSNRSGATWSTISTLPEAAVTRRISFQESAADAARDEASGRWSQGPPKTNAAGAGRRRRGRR